MTSADFKQNKRTQVKPKSDSTLLLRKEFFSGKHHEVFYMPVIRYNLNIFLKASSVKASWTKFVILN